MPWFVQSEVDLDLETAPFDPRSICNLILDEADGRALRLTNLALQKLLYFAHGLFLIETKTPLVTGFFEAWQFGPVHPTAYHAFKVAGASPIDFRAELRDPFTKNVLSLPICSDPDAIARVKKTVILYGAMTPGRLVEVSHAKNAPWAYILNEARTRTILGLRISDDVIRDRFKFHKVSIDAEPRYGEPREEAPFD